MDGFSTFEVMGREEYYWNMLGASVLLYEACQVDAIKIPLSSVSPHAESLRLATPGRVRLTFAPNIAGAPASGPWSRFTKESVVNQQ